MVSSLGADNKAKLWLCLVIGDETEENPELNRMFILRIGENDKWLVREAEVIETANLLITFEHIYNEIFLKFVFEITIIKRFSVY